MKKIILLLSIIVAAGLVFVNLYTSLIDARSWAADIPNSIATARDYFKTVNPGNFFRIFSPLNQILGLVSLIVFWKSSLKIRLFLGAAFLLYITGEGLTFGYFYPRNDIMFKHASLTDIALLKKTCSEWASMNWVRSAVILAGLIFSVASMHLIYSLNRK